MHVAWRVVKERSLLSVAAKSFTGMFTRPNAIAPLHRARAMVCRSSGPRRRGRRALNGLAIALTLNKVNGARRVGDLPRSLRILAGPWLEAAPRNVRTKPIGQGGTSPWTMAQPPSTPPPGSPAGPPPPFPYYPPYPYYPPPKRDNLPLILVIVVIAIVIIPIVVAAALYVMVSGLLIGPGTQPVIAFGPVDESAGNATISIGYSSALVNPFSLLFLLQANYSYPQASGLPPPDGSVLVETYGQTFRVYWLDEDRALVGTGDTFRVTGDGSPLPRPATFPFSLQSPSRPNVATVERST